MTAPAVLMHISSHTRTPHPCHRIPRNDTEALILAFLYLYLASSHGSRAEDYNNRLTSFAGTHPVHDLTTCMATFTSSLVHHPSPSLVFLRVSALVPHLSLLPGAVPSHAPSLLRFPAHASPFILCAGLSLCLLAPLSLRLPTWSAER
ncbi:hypothetical protein NUW54_g13433 [Trametes sanguinea]|uniref:Uncharacterized protein n=1 Tax=Trametes sanguinea TaxID=158606 RepID=A0ACC1MNA1_9APHY|nr:hypothetical protein NUW54_g13433 [Trametes sanguinea]